MKPLHYLLVCLLLGGIVFLTAQDSRSVTKSQSVIRIMILDPNRTAYDGFTENTKLFNQAEWYAGKRDKWTTSQRMLDDGWEFREVVNASGSADFYLVFTK